MCWGKKYFSFLLLIVLFFIPDVSFASNGKAIDDRVKAQIGRLSIPFIENVGQVENNDVSFYAKTFGGTVFITKKGDIVYSLPESNKTKNISQGIIKNNTESVIAMNKTQKQSNIKSVIPSEARNLKAITSSSARNEDKTTPLRVIALKEELIGGSVTEVKGEGKSVTKVNYFKGNDPSKWRNNIPTHNLVSLGEVFSGIALKLKAYGNNVEKLFYIKPYANFEDIKLKLEGAKGIRINEKGELEVKTELGTVKFTKPIAYQEIDGKRVEVVVSYLIPQSEISNTQFEYGFKVGNYDRTKELVIDPLLASTFLGGSNYESGVFVSPLSQISMAIDKGRNIYLVGNTYSSDFPTTTGVHDTSFNSGYSDAIISKLNSNLTTLLASTFIGGSGWDDAESIAVDISGNVYVTGYTGSLDFPTTPGAYDTSFNGGSDAFVSKFNSNLTILLASTFLGRSVWYEGTYAESIAIDTGGNIYVAGWTYSSDFPTTTGAYDTSFNGGPYDAFISKLSNDLTTLLASTFLGGSSSYEFISSIAIDAGGNIFVTGFTYSSDFPTTTGAYDTSFNGGSDAFVSKFNSNLTILLASTFLGGSGGDDNVMSIVIDSYGNIYVSGRTSSSDFPTTTGAYDTSLNGVTDAFISKLNSNLSTLLASTFLGGSGSNEYVDIWTSILDSYGNIYVSGWTSSSDFPITTGAYDTSLNGVTDAFISKVNSNLSTLLASTFLGGSGSDEAHSIAIDTGGNIYVAGYTDSSDFPTTIGAYDTSFNGGNDLFIVKMDMPSLNLKWPLEGTSNNRTVFQGFGADCDPRYYDDCCCNGLLKKHVGIDISAGIGEKVFAAEEGDVKHIGNIGDGKAITIEHTWSGKNFTTAYLHVDPIVSVGEHVTKGQEIATIAYISHPHLHFGVRMDSYSDTSHFGLLPQTDCDGKPQFPEHFVNPIDIFSYHGNIPNSSISLTAKATSTSSILITWQDEIDNENETGFKIERKIGEDGTYAQIATVGTDITSYLNTGLTPQTTYYYRVRAIIRGCDSSYSNEAHAVTLPACNNSPVRISGNTPVYYSTLQAAYNAAVNGDIIQSQAVNLIESLNINRNISVTIEGGYICDYSANSGNATYLKGQIKTWANGGKLTIKNIVIQK